ncbi:MAG: HAMP domain-containing protein [Oscillospiraceae bacterium]|jgi:signal transduction histidine kinase|nr:HAMP domain-containing protein [Oscillospiraceae bacterium]
MKIPRLGMNAFKAINKPHGIKRRWLINSLTVVIAVVLIGVVAYSVSISAYYYSGMRASLETKAKTASEFLQDYFSRTYAEYYQTAYAYAERFDERDRIELQFVSAAGKVEASTYGITAGTHPGTPEITEALDTKNVAVWSGKSPRTDERIIAVSSPIMTSNGRLIGLMRYVSALSEVDKLVALNIGAASGIGLLIVITVVSANLFFIRSIVAPVQEVTAMTRAIADGGYGARIENKYGDEIGEMVESINEMSMKISQTEKLKTEFISTVSHELRTPLTAITGWSETLLYDDALKSDTRRGLSIILKESRRLAVMVEELLDITRVEEGRFTVRLEPTDIELLLDEAITAYEDVFRRDGIQLEYIPADDPLSEIPGDPARLKQVFLNILDNAAKYGKSGGKTVITCNRVTEDKRDYAEVTVRDFGIGIPEDELEFVKYKFYKGSSKERGSGVGLAVCDEIVKHHRGKLTIENASDGAGGVEVKIRLPMT